MDQRPGRLNPEAGGHGGLANASGENNPFEQRPACATSTLFFDDSRPDLSNLLATPRSSHLDNAVWGRDGHPR